MFTLLSGCLTQQNGTDEIPPDNTPDTGPVNTNGTNTEDPPEQDFTDKKPTLEDIGLGILEVLVFDAGSADAILITTENHAVMIDTGERDHGPEIVEYLLGRGIIEIDYMIITHFDRDHVGGAAEIINNINVKEVVVPNYRRESSHYLRFAEAMVKNGIIPVVSEVNNPLEFTLDSAVFITYPSSLEFFDFDIEITDDEGIDYDDPDSDDAGEDAAVGVNINNYSLVTTISFGDVDFLFTGDAKSRRIKEIMETEAIANTVFDFLKIPHHGMYSRRTAELIQAIKPKYAVITNPAYRPADERVLAALIETGTEIFSTQNGRVYIESNGYALVVHQQ